MDFMYLLNAAGGSDSLGQLATTVGLGSKDTSKLVEALAPALMRGMQKNTADDSGLAGLRRALETGGHDRYIDKPELLSAAETRTDGNNILGHIFGSKDVSRNVAAVAAKDTGIDASLIKKVLPVDSVLSATCSASAASPAAGSTISWEWRGSSSDIPVGRSTVRHDNRWPTSRRPFFYDSNAGREVTSIITIPTNHQPPTMTHSYGQMSAAGLNGMNSIPIEQDRMNAETPIVRQ
jgi:hypothetical protein